jgi:hypothetical protein
MLEQNPECVMGYFQDRRVRYAAKYFTRLDQRTIQTDQSIEFSQLGR